MPVAELLPFPLCFHPDDHIPLLVDLPRSRIPPPLSSGDSSLFSRPAVSSVFHLRAKYLARRWWPDGEKRQGWHGGVRKERAGLRAFPGVRTKGATLGRLGGTRVERKRVVGAVRVLRKTREKSEK